MMACSPEAGNATLTQGQKLFMLLSLLFFIQFNVPFKIVSAHMRRANQ